MGISDFWTTDRRTLLRVAGALSLVPAPLRAGLEPSADLWQALAETVLDCDASDLVQAHGESQGLQPHQLAQRLPGCVLREPQAVRGLFFAGLAALRFSPLLSGYPAVFESLPLPQRRAVYRSWLSSALPPVQSLAMALRSAALFLWFSDPGAWAAIGYTGPWVPREGLKP